MTNHETPAHVTAIYDAIDAFQRTHRLPGLQHAQIRALLAEHLGRAFPAAVSVPPPAPRADDLRLADQLVERCPDHGCVEPEWADGCHCEIVPLLRRMADGARQPEPEAEPTAEEIARANVLALHLRCRWRLLRPVRPLRRLPERRGPGVSGPPWWLAYAWVVSLWVAAGCAGMAVFSACIDRVGRNGPEKGPERP